MEKTVVELFAGVGGFRVGLNKIKDFNVETGLANETGSFNFVWANQYEPSTKIQPAYNCYTTRFGLLNHSNTDINIVVKSKIPNHSLLVGGFPCQDYSVARTLSNESGIKGKKGVLWWQIYEILKIKKTPFVLLENVDRLLKSPSNQRGRDFGIMLRSLSDLGYFVEWTVINAADYGFPQRRRRVFIYAALNNTNFFKKISMLSPTKILKSESIFSKPFPRSFEKKKLKSVDLTINSFTDLSTVTDKFETNFENTGFILNGIVYTVKSNPLKTDICKLKDILDKTYDDSLILDENQLKKIEKAKGAKKQLRTSKTGFQYYYSEGRMNTADSLELPGRTMLTSEGTINRSTHIIKINDNTFRFISPEECEKLNLFPVGWTSNIQDMSKRKRYFMMGNALVTGIVSKLGDEISKIIDSEE